MYGEMHDGVGMKVSVRGIQNSNQLLSGSGGAKFRNQPPTIVGTIVATPNNLNYR